MGLGTTHYGNVAENVTQPSDSSTEEQQTVTSESAVSEDTQAETEVNGVEETPKVEEKEKFIPRDRFDKVNEEKNLLKKQIEEMNTLKRSTTIEPTESQSTTELTPEEQQAREALSKMGYLHKDDLEKYLRPIYEEKKTEKLNRFYERHPDMVSQSDPDNIRWNQMAKHFNKFNPKTTSFDEILEKSYEWAFPRSNEYLKQEAVNEVLINNKKVEEASLGSGGGTTSQKASPKLSQDQLKIAQKFNMTPEEYEKYSN